MCGVVLALGDVAQIKKTVVFIIIFAGKIIGVKIKINALFCRCYFGIIPISLQNMILECQECGVQPSNIASLSVNRRWQTITTTRFVLNFMNCSWKTKDPNGMSIMSFLLLWQTFSMNLISYKRNRPHQLQS